MGGFVGGGALFGLSYQLTMDKPAQSALFGAVGLLILGACIGSLSAFVQGVFQPASVKVMRGWQEGREYPLDKADNRVGRDEHADIALFRDMRVEKLHAVIQRAGKRYVLKNAGAPPEFTRVNERAACGSPRTGGRRSHPIGQCRAAFSDARRPAAQNGRVRIRYLCPFTFRAPCGET